MGDPLKEYIWGRYFRIFPAYIFNAPFFEWLGYRHRSKSRSLSDEEKEKIAEACVFLGIAAAVICAIALVIMFRFEILTILAGIGLSLFVGWVAKETIHERFNFPTWALLTLSVLAAAPVVAVTGFEVRRLFLFHQWEFPAGMLGQWGGSLLSVGHAAIVEVGIILGLNKATDLRKPSSSQPLQSSQAVLSPAATVGLEVLTNVNNKSDTAESTQEMVERHIQEQQEEQKIRQIMRDARKYGIFYKALDDL